VQRTFFNNRDKFDLMDRVVATSFQGEPSSGKRKGFKKYSAASCVSMGLPSTIKQASPSPPSKSGVAVAFTFDAAAVLHCYELLALV